MATSNTQKTDKSFFSHHPLHSVHTRFNNLSFMGRVWMTAANVSEFVISPYCVSFLPGMDVKIACHTKEKGYYKIEPPSNLYRVLHAAIWLGAYAIDTLEDNPRLVTRATFAGMLAIKLVNWIYTYNKLEEAPAGFRTPGLYNSCGQNGLHLAAGDESLDKKVFKEMLQCYDLTEVDFKNRHILLHLAESGDREKIKSVLKVLSKEQGDKLCEKPDKNGKYCAQILIEGSWGEKNLPKDIKPVIQNPKNQRFFMDAYYMERSEFDKKYRSSDPSNHWGGFYNDHNDFINSCYEKWNSPQDNKLLTLNENIALGKARLEDFTEVGFYSPFTMYLIFKHQKLDMMRSLFSNNFHQLSINLFLQFDDDQNILDCVFAHVPVKEDIEAKLLHDLKENLSSVYRSYPFEFSFLLFVIYDISEQDVTEKSLLIQIANSAAKPQFYIGLALLKKKIDVALGLFGNLLELLVKFKSHMPIYDMTLQQLMEGLEYFGIVTNEDAVTQAIFNVIESLKIITNEMRFPLIKATFDVLFKIGTNGKYLFIERHRNLFLSTLEKNASDLLGREVTIFDTTLEKDIEQIKSLFVLFAKLIYEHDILGDTDVENLKQFDLARQELALDIALKTGAVQSTKNFKDVNDELYTPERLGSILQLEEETGFSRLYTQNDIHEDIRKFHPNANHLSCARTLVTKCTPIPALQELLAQHLKLDDSSKTVRSFDLENWSLFYFTAVFGSDEMLKYLMEKQFRLEFMDQRDLGNTTSEVYFGFNILGMTICLKKFKNLELLIKDEKYFKSWHKMGPENLLGSSHLEWLFNRYANVDTHKEEFTNLLGLVLNELPNKKKYRPRLQETTTASEASSGDGEKTVSEEKIKEKARGYRHLIRRIKDREFAKIVAGMFTAHQLLAEDDIKKINSWKKKTGHEEST